MHVWPAKVICPDLTYEAVTVMSDNTDVVIQARNGAEMRRAPAKWFVHDQGRVTIETEAGETWEATRRPCGCGGSRSYPTVQEPV